MTWRSCIEPGCGEVSDETRCLLHRGEVTRKGNTTQRGYDQRWRRLSERARKAQPWCSDCGSRYDLTGDHSVRAWMRYDAGLVIRLKDVDVVCRSCNGKRGRARAASDPGG